MIPIEPTMISWTATKIRSELTTAPIVVRLRCSAIGPSSLSRAAATSPSLPWVGIFVLPDATGGDADAPADGPTEADGLADADADGDGLAEALAGGLADGLALAPALALGAGEPLAGGSGAEGEGEAAG